MAKSTEMLAQAQKVWGNLGLGQKAAIVGITLAVFGGVLLTTFLASQPDYKALRTGLQVKEIGTITAQLDSIGVSDYKITADGTTILVNSNDFERARGALYQAGIIPAADGEEADLGLLGVGGLTGSAEKYYHLRQDEKRLARLLREVPDVEDAKVTITKRVTKFYKAGDLNAKAAVIVKTRNGVWHRNLSDSIAMTVAGGVEGLSPDEVAITANGTLVRRPGRKGDLGISDEDQIAVQSKLEEEREFKAQEALNLVAGPGKVVVRVAVDLDWTRHQINEKKYDPEGVRTERVKTESFKDSPVASSGGTPGSQAAVTGASSSGSAFKNTSTTEHTQYGMTESQKVKVGPELKRMTAAILIDQSLEAKKDEISKIVGAAIGLDQSRGDEISVMVMEMAVQPETAFEVEDDGSTTSVAVSTWIERGLWALVGIAFLFFALRTVKKAQAGLRDVLEASLEEAQPIEAPKPITLEENVLETAMQDTELAGRSLRRWLYEGVGEKA